MRQLLALFFDIALSRRGPQDLPASPLLLAITSALYVLASYGANSLVAPVGGLWWLLFVDLGFSLLWYATLLRLFRKPERFLQTATAAMGYKIVLELPLFAVMALARGFNDESFWRFPVAILGLVLIFLLIRAGSYVLKAALELPVIACIALVFAEVFATQLVVFAFMPASAPTPK
jgi:hypothetical protein